MLTVVALGMAVERREHGDSEAGGGDRDGGEGGHGGHGDSRGSLGFSALWPCPLPFTAGPVNNRASVILTSLKAEEVSVGGPPSSPPMPGMP